MIQLSQNELPDFAAPPLDEVALGVQFGEIERLGTIHYGLLFERLKDRYPKFEEKEPFETRFEVFGKATVRQASLSFLAQPPLRRLWFVSDDGHELVQFQPNRFVHNWRKLSGLGSYPRFPTVAQKFLSEFDEIKRFAHDNDLGDVRVNQCELTYVNHIILEDGEEFGSAFKKYLGYAVELGGRNPFGNIAWGVESHALKTQVRVSRSDSELPFARLHIEATPAEIPRGVRAIRLVLVMRGLSSDVGQSDVVGFMNDAHECLVRAFACVTTRAAHEEWKRTR